MYWVIDNTGVFQAQGFNEGLSMLYINYVMTAYFIPGIISWLYFSVQESSVHQATLGKRAFGIKVVNEQCAPIGFPQATGRYFGKYLSGIFLIGYIMMFFKENRQGLHDVMAKTYVIKSS